MKKAFVLLAAFCALTATASDKTATELLVEKIWNVTSESTFAQPLYSVSKNGHHLTYDVSCDIRTVGFGFAEPPTALYLGQPFIVIGYIYPGGTFDANGAESGVVEDGPQWPDMQLGTWNCRGYIWQPAAVTTQVFLLSDNNTIVTDGYEVIDPSMANHRAITGGTNDYSHARGESLQWVIGTNASSAPNFTFTFEFQKEIQFKMGN